MTAQIFPSHLYLPFEMWENIFDHFDRETLDNFQQVCQHWKDLVISYVMNGRLANRALESIFILIFGKIRFSSFFCTTIHFF